MDLQEIKENYAAFNNERIIELARDQSHELPVKVTYILKEEIEKRNLPIELLEVIDNLNDDKYKIIAEIDLYRHKLSNQPCPICNEKSTPLKAFNYRSELGLVFLTTSNFNYSISCEECAKKTISLSNTKNWLVGWFSLFGPFKTIRNLIHNSKSKELYILGDDKTIFDDIIFDNYGKLKMLNDDGLLYFLKNFNDPSVRPEDV